LINFVAKNQATYYKPSNPSSFYFFNQLSSFDGIDKILQVFLTVLPIEELVNNILITI
jgi:hypothetical protein